MGRSLGCPPGIPMELHWYCSIGAPWKCLMGNALAIHPMWLLWDWMGSGHWELHGVVLWVMQWDSLGADHWGFHSKCSMGMPLGCPDGAPMALHWYCSIGAPWKCLMGNTLGIPPHVASMGGWMWIDHWELHGILLWLMHWDSMGLHRWLVVGNTMEVHYG